MDLNKHIVSDNTGKPFHSSGIARINRGDRLGVDTNVSFNQRQQINGNRQLINDYHSSVIGSTRSVLAARPVSPEAIDSRLRVPARQPLKPPRSTTQGITIPPRSFNEPNARGYNPYS